MLENAQKYSKIHKNTRKSEAEEYKAEESKAEGSRGLSGGLSGGFPGGSREVPGAPWPLKVGGLRPPTVPGTYTQNLRLPFSIFDLDNFGVFLLIFRHFECLFFILVICRHSKAEYST